VRATDLIQSAAWAEAVWGPAPGRWLTGDGQGQRLVIFTVFQLGWGQDMKTGAEAPVQNSDQSSIDHHFAP
jgi:hypothetical protein